MAALVAVVMNLLYKSREENEVLTFWLSSCPEGNVILSLSKGVEGCVKTKARKNFLKLNKRN